jgi:hypothetical protein
MFCHAWLPRVQTPATLGHLTGIELWVQYNACKSRAPQSRKPLPDPGCACGAFGRAYCCYRCFNSQYAPMRRVHRIER